MGLTIHSKKFQFIYSLVHLVVAKLEELISRTLLGLFKIRLLFQDRVRSQNLRFEWQCSSDHFFVLIQRTRPFSIEIGIEIEGFPVLKTTSICQSCNKSIRTKQANPSTDTDCIFFEMSSTTTWWWQWSAF